jgi:acyl-coenzyme A synthetase/AMP-(fatty) acid ligase
VTTIGGLLAAVQLAGSTGAAARVINIGADRPGGGSGFNEFVDSGRSELVVTPRTAGDLAITEELRYRPTALSCVESVIHSGSPVPRAHVQDLVDVIGERYIEVWGMTEGVAPFSLSPSARCSACRTSGGVSRRPQRVHFAAAMPRNASLKVRKDQLRAELAMLDGTGGQD